MKGRAILNFTVGFLNTTAFLFGNDRSKCQFGVENVISAAKAANEQYYNGTGYFNFLNFIDKAL